MKHAYDDEAYIIYYWNLQHDLQLIKHDVAKKLYRMRGSEKLIIWWMIYYYLESSKTIYK